MSRLAADTLRQLVDRALQNAGTAPGNAAIVADALVAAELDGLASHGVSRLPAYADQVTSGKVDGAAQPRLLRTAAAAVAIDACHGFAHPAIRLGIEHAVPKTLQAGACVLTIGQSHHAGVLGHHVERIAESGLIGLGFTNSPAAIAPWGGHKGVFGTNPIAFAAPRAAAEPLVIDLSLSRVARGQVMLASQQGRAIPDDWALDQDGLPTTDATAGLAGTMVPAGGAKGAALALMVEILAAALTGAHYGFEASSFFTADGPPPSVGQSFLLIDPKVAGAEFDARLELLLAAITDQPEARLPGARRFCIRQTKASDGIEIDDKLFSEIRARAAPTNTLV